MNVDRDKEFWSRVAIKEPNDCWNYKGYIDKGGYGIFSVGKVIRAHRFAWQSYNKRMVSKNLYILHRCDNPSCCNPAHLYEGTQSDNMRDRIIRGHIARHIARRKDGWLYAGEVWLIKRMRDIKVRSYGGHIGRYGSLREFVGQMFKISPKVIGAIWNGRRYFCREQYYI